MAQNRYAGSQLQIGPRRNRGLPDLSDKNDAQPQCRAGDHPKKHGQTRTRCNLFARSGCRNYAAVRRLCALLDGGFLQSGKKGFVQQPGCAGVALDLAQFGCHTGILFKFQLKRCKQLRQGSGLVIEFGAFAGILGDQF